MTRKSVSVFVFVLVAFVSVAGAIAVTQGDRAGLDGGAVARAYIAGMEAADLDKLTELFLTDDRSSILENASDEGSWEHYRDHHLAPEIEAAGDFKFTLDDEIVERFGDTQLVRMTGFFTVEIEDELRKFRVAVSFVIVPDDGELRIAHLHWSSRAARR